MDTEIINEIIMHQLQVKATLELKVAGNSMNPLLEEGDKITVIKDFVYNPGDILVFLYKKEKILIHRLLKKDNNTYFCKGDNSFRLEDIKEHQIIGKVIKINDSTILPCTDELINLSYLVNREFRKCRYNHENTKNSTVYTEYKKYINKLFAYKKK